MLVGTAWYVRLMVYVGLSLFIIRRAYVYLVVCVLTHKTLHGGPKKWQKQGRAKWVLSHFCRVKERSCSFWNSTFKFQLFQEIFALFIHSPYQTGSQPMSGR